jgi:hypothetical protein
MPACLSDSIPQHSDRNSQPTSSHPYPQHRSLKSLKKAANGIVQDSEESERKVRLKRKAKDITEQRAQVHDSFERHQVKSEADDGVPTAVGNPPLKSGQVLRFRSSQASKRFNDESDDLSSPTLLSFPDGALGSSTANSRAGTPGAPNRPSRKPKSGLRMKTS